jgi:hypothetical protein|nr:MAG TPA: hypothetical protein [Caudoviricetes sp.]
MRITRKGIFVKDSNQWFEDFKNTLFYQVLEFLIHTTENEIDFNNGIRILKSGDNKIFFEYVADNEFHKKTVNDIIELMKEKEKNHE